MASLSAESPNRPTTTSETTIDSSSPKSPLLPTLEPERHPDPPIQAEDSLDGATTSVVGAVGVVGVVGAVMTTQRSPTTRPPQKDEDPRPAPTRPPEPVDESPPTVLFQPEPKQASSPPTAPQPARESEGTRPQEQVGFVPYTPALHEQPTTDQNKPTDENPATNGEFAADGNPPTDENPATDGESAADGNPPTDKNPAADGESAADGNPPTDENPATDEKRASTSLPAPEPTDAPEELVTTTSSGGTSTEQPNTKISYTSAAILASTLPPTYHAAIPLDGMSSIQPGKKHLASAPSIPPANKTTETLAPPASPPAPPPAPPSLPPTEPALGQPKLPASDLPLPGWHQTPSPLQAPSTKKLASPICAPAVEATTVIAHQTLTSRIIPLLGFVVAMLMVIVCMRIVVHCTSTATIETPTEDATGMLGPSTGNRAYLSRSTGKTSIEDETSYVSKGPDGAWAGRVPTNRRGNDATPTGAGMGTETGGTGIDTSTSSRLPTERLSWTDRARPNAMGGTGGAITNETTGKTESTSNDNNTGGSGGSTPDTTETTTTDQTFAAAALDCANTSTSTGVMVIPTQPVVGQPFRLVAADLEANSPLALRLEGPHGPVNTRQVTRTGVPSTIIATARVMQPGEYRVAAGSGPTACQAFTVRASEGNHVPPSRSELVWPLERAWNPAEEALYSAWVRELFHIEPGQRLTYTRLDQVTSKVERNLLYNSLGWEEDTPEGTQSLYLRPDCADVPYFLRAYWSWKRRLPFAYRSCTRGSSKQPPTCRPPHGNTIRHGRSSQPGELGYVQKFMRRTLAWGVHTGNGRIPYQDSGSDFYPVSIRRSSLRPGTIYADPYGHILVVSEIIDGSDGQPGTLYAIDGQPDGTIGRKRFWEGTFLWSTEPAVGGIGFKQFRPVVYDGRKITQLSNEALGAGEYHFWTGYEELSRNDFYRKVEDVLNPGIRNPLTEQDLLFDALLTAVTDRAAAVSRGAKAIGPRTTVLMPKGHAVFESQGVWESYSTPGRDLRLLIAMDVVAEFPEKVRANPRAFGLVGDDVQATITQLKMRHQQLLKTPKYRFDYQRSDGSRWELSLADVFSRMPALETGYHPQDCPERRWGAPPGSNEEQTCRGQASARDRKRIESYRKWFQTRRLPARDAKG